LSVANIFAVAVRIRMEEKRTLLNIKNLVALVEHLAKNFGHMKPWKSNLWFKHFSNFGASGILC